MEDFETLRHKNTEHARTVWVNWNMDEPTGKHPWVKPSPKELLNFSARMVDHYQVTLGKRLYVEFSGATLNEVDGFFDLIGQLHQDGARIGLYSETIYDAEFWERAMPFIKQVCFKVTHGQHDPEHLVVIANMISGSIDLHINYEIDPTDFKKSVSDAKKMAAAITEITINLLLPSDGADAETAQRMDGANAMVRRAAAENRTRPRSGHRGSMIMVRDGVDIEITSREMLNQGINEFEGWSCMAGVEQLVITNEGDIIRGWCRQGGAIGSVCEVEVPFPVSAFTCRAEKCHSVVDLSCSKSWC